MLLHMRDRIPDRIGASRDGRNFGLGGDLPNGRSVNVDREQERADFVVQVTGEIRALFLLHRRQLLVELAVARFHVPEPLRHVVEAAAKLLDFGRTLRLDARAVVAAAQPLERPEQPRDRVQARARA